MLPRKKKGSAARETRGADFRPADRKELWGGGVWMKWKAEKGSIASRRECLGVSWCSGESVVDDRSRDVEASGPWAGAGEGGGPLGEVGGVSRARFLWTILRNMGFISSYYRLTTLIYFCENRTVWTCLERHFFMNSGSLHCTSGAVPVLPRPRTVPCGFLQPVLLPILLHAAQHARHVPAFRPCHLPFLMPWLLCSFFFWYSGLSLNRQALVSAQGCWKCWVCLRRAASDSGPRGLAPCSGSGGCPSSPPAPWHCLSLPAPLFPLISFSWSFLSCPLLGTLVPVVLCGSGQETCYFYF